MPLSAILNAAGVLPGATEVVITGLDGYYTQLPLATVMDSSAFLAYQVDGQNLTWERGYPLRLILSNSFVGANMPRWISSIEVKSSLTSYSNPSATIQMPAATSLRLAANYVLVSFLPPWQITKW